MKYIGYKTQYALLAVNQELLADLLQFYNRDPELISIFANKEKILRVITEEIRNYEEITGRLTSDSNSPQPSTC